MLGVFVYVFWFISGSSLYYIYFSELPILPICINVWTQFTFLSCPIFTIKGWCYLVSRGYWINGAAVEHILQRVIRWISNTIGQAWMCVLSWEMDKGKAVLKKKVPVHVSEMLNNCSLQYTRNYNWHPDTHYIGFLSLLLRVEETELFERIDINTNVLCRFFANCVLSGDFSILHKVNCKWLSLLHVYGNVKMLNCLKIQIRIRDYFLLYIRT